MMSGTSLVDGIIAFGERMLANGQDTDIDDLLGLWRSRERLLAEWEGCRATAGGQVSRASWQRLSQQNEELLTLLLRLRTDRGERLLALARRGHAAHCYIVTAA